MAIYEGTVQHDLTVQPGDDVAQVTGVRGTLTIRADDIAMPRLLQVDGHLTIQGDRFWADGLVNVNKALHIYGADSSLANLTNVQAYLKIVSDNVSLPKLHRAGLVEIQGKNPKLPALGLITESLHIKANDVVLPSLVVVGDWLAIRASFVDLPNLALVMGSVDIKGQNNQMPMLTSIRKGLSLSEGNIDLPNLIDASDGFDIDEDSRITAPRLQRIANIPVRPLQERQNLLRRVAEAVLTGHPAPEARVSPCETTLEIATLAIQLSPLGKDIERRVRNDMLCDFETLVTANILLGVETSPLFTMSKTEARKALKRVLNDQPLFQ